MGCPGGPRSVFTRASRTKRDLHCVFLGKKAIIIISNTAQRSFFSHYNVFLGKLKDKLARKSRVNIERVYRIMLMPPGHPIILLKSNKFNMAAVSVKRSIESKYQRAHNSVLALKQPSFSCPFKSPLLVVIKQPLFPQFCEAFCTNQSDDLCRVLTLILFLFPWTAEYFQLDSSNFFIHILRR